MSKHFARVVNDHRMPFFTKCDRLLNPFYVVNTKGCKRHPAVWHAFDNEQERGVIDFLDGRDDSRTACTFFA